MTPLIWWFAHPVTRTQREYWLSYAVIVVVLLMCVVEIG